MFRKNQAQGALKYRNRRMILTPRRVRASRKARITRKELEPSAAKMDCTARSTTASATAIATMTKSNAFQRASWVDLAAFFHMFSMSDGSKSKHDVNQTESKKICQ